MFGRGVCDFFGLNHVPPRSTIQNVNKKFKTRYTLQDLTKSSRARTARMLQNTGVVTENVYENPKTSIRF